MFKNMMLLTLYRRAARLASKIEQEHDVVHKSRIARSDRIPYLGVVSALPL